MAYEESGARFPDDLSEQRYVAFKFYDSDFTSDMKKIAEDVAVYTIQQSDRVTNNATSTGAIGAGETTRTGEGKDNNSLSATLIGLGTKAKDKKNFNADGTPKFDKDTQKYVMSSGSSRSSLENAVFKYNIYLPIPNGIREQITHGWKAETGAVSSTVSQILPGAVTDAVKNIGKAFGARTLLLNPDYVQTYEGSSLRSFVMNWVLTPKSEEEATTIFEIVRMFKRGASPERNGGGLTLLPPLFCQVEFANEIIGNSVKMDEMVITNISVNYSETGFMETFGDGMPKAIMFEMTLSERRMKLESDWV